MVTKIRKSGNVYVLRIPKAILTKAQIRVGDNVSVFARGRRIVVEPLSKRGRAHDLKKLVAQIPKDYRPEEIQWGAPVSKETW